MKIWFAADIPKDSHGGVARSMHELSEGLRYRGYGVTLFYRDTIRSNNYLTFAFKFCIRFLLSGLNRPDWIIARSTDGIFCALVIRLLRFSTGIILHNHGWEENVYSIEKKLPHTIISTPTTWKSIIVRIPLLRLMLKTCTYCMSGTMNEIVYLGNKYPKMRNKLIYIPNGVIAQKDIHWKNREEYPCNFLSIGNVTWKKNIRHTIKTFSLIREKYSNALLYCIGTGVDDTTLFKHINSNMEGVINKPSVSFEEMKDWYTSCPFMIASSRYEGGHSLAILEAMSFGVVVFASSIKSNKEIIKDDSNGYLITGSDIDYDAGSILKKLTQSTNQKVRINASETAKQNLWSLQVTRLEKILCKKQ